MEDSNKTESDLQHAGWKQRTLAGFVQSAGPLWTRREGEAWQYGFLTNPGHANPAGVVHGGVLATLMDHTLSAIAWEAMGRRACVTVQLNTQFLAPVVPGAFLMATGHVARAARSLVFMLGEVSAGDGVVMTGSAVLKVLSSGDSESTRR
jgi:uncharacterized protein (TIGR00369 family)